MARMIRVAAFTDLLDKSPRTVQDNLDWTCGLLDRMACEKPDIVCLTEVFDTLGTGLKHADMAQSLEGPTFPRMMEKAREHGFNIVCAFTEQRENGIYNVAAVIDRLGSLAGRYDKIHPTNSEIEDGVLPGKTNPTVIETDVARIGCQICFDANWHADWGALKQAGAEIIFFPSAFSGGRIIQAIATLYHLPIVAACCRQCCRIVDRDGLILNRQGVYQPWVSAAIDLDTPLFHLDYQFEKLEAIRRDFGPAVTIRVYEEEGWWRILPNAPDVSVPQIIADYQLETLDDYIARSEAFQKAHRLPVDAYPGA